MKNFFEGGKALKHFTFFFSMSRNRQNKRSILMTLVSIIFYTAFLCPTITFSQNPEWLNFTAGANLQALSDEGDCIWVGGQGGLTKLDKATGEMTCYNKSNSEFPTNFVQALLVDPEGNKWIGMAFSGLAMYDGFKWVILNSQNSWMTNNSSWINAIKIDTEVIKWIGTAGGLAKFDSVNWTVYTKENSGLPSNYVMAVAFDTHGNKWIATWNGGLGVYREGGVILTGVEGRSNLNVPKAFALFQNYPNPFNPSTTIEYMVSQPLHVELKVYGVLGHEVQTLVNERQESGMYQVHFKSQGLPTGLYFYHLRAGEFCETKKMVIVK